VIPEQLSNFSLCAASVVLDLYALLILLCSAHAADVIADWMADWARPDYEGRRADGSTYRKRPPVGTARTGPYVIDDNGAKAGY
jgi:hypothetical protein